MKTAHSTALLGLAAGALLLSACSPTPTREPEVSVAVPVQRLDLPEKPSRHLSAGWDAGSAQTNVVLAQDQTVTTPDPASAAFQSHHGTGGIWVEAYPFSALGLGVTVRTNGSDSDSNDDDSEAVLRGRVKLHLIDAGGFSVAATGAYGERSYEYVMNHVEDDDFFGFDGGHLEDDAVTRIDAYERDFALVAGWRAADSLLVFGGPFLYQQPYSGTHTDHDAGNDGGGSGTGSDPGDCTVAGLLCDDGGNGDTGSGDDPPGPVTTAFSDRIDVRGFNAGVAVNLGMPELRLIAEVASAQIDLGNGRTDDTVGVSLAFRGDFGGKL